MLKLFTSIILILISINSLAQKDITPILIKIADKTATPIALNIHNNCKIIKTILNLDKNLNICVYDIKNVNNEITIISKQLSPILANQIGTKLNALKYSCLFYTVNYYKNLDSNFCSVALKANYLISDSSFTIYNITLSKQNKQFNLPTITINSYLIDSILDYDVKPKSFFANKLLKIQDNSKLIDSIKLKAYNNAKFFMKSDYYQLNKKASYALFIYKQTLNYVYVFIYYPKTELFQLFYPISKPYNRIVPQPVKVIKFQTDNTDNEAMFIIIVTKKIIPLNFLPLQPMPYPYTLNSNETKEILNSLNNNVFSKYILKFKW